MPIVLFTLIAGFLSWPYYHRMKSFKLPSMIAYAAGLVPSIIIAASLVNIVLRIQNGTGFEAAIVAPDLVSKLVFVIILVLITCTHFILMITAESVGYKDLDGGYFILCLVFSAALAWAVSFSLMSLW